MAASLTKIQSCANPRKVQTSGTALTVTLVENDYLWIHQTLETTDVVLTPILELMDLSPPSAIPEVETIAATLVLDTSVQLNGNLDSLGTETTVNVYFQYREVGAAIWLETVSQELSAPGDFHASVTGLDPETSYEFRAVVSYGISTAFGAVLTFATYPINFARVSQFYLEVGSTSWSYDIDAQNMRLTPALSDPLFGLDLSVEALSMRLSPQLNEAPLYVAYVLTADGSRLLSRLSEARINTQGLCIFYTFTGHLCILEQLEAKQAILADMTEDLGVYDSLEVYEPINYKLEVVWRT